MNEIVYDANNPICISCNELFIPNKREQGGGRYQLYCSAKCRAKYWARGNVKKRKLSVIKYDNKLESKRKKRERSLKYKFKKYDVNEIWFIEQLKIQSYKCLGCFKDIDKYTARIDHNHITNKVRGLLCDRCNWAIGHVKDNKDILRNLIAYLETHD